MFIGHFGVGFGAKAVAPKVSLGSLFLAAQFIDLLWPTFLLLGFERVRIASGATTVTPLVFEHYPISHSLLAVSVWAFVVALVYWIIRRERRGAAVVGLLVLSHWLLDAIVHKPDLPLFPGNSPLVGLDLWWSLPATLVVESSIFAFGVWLYARRTTSFDRYGKWGFWALVVCLSAIYAGNVLGPPPPSVAAIAWTGQLQWLFVVWGYWLDRHRTNISY